MAIAELISGRVGGDTYEVRRKRKVRIVRDERERIAAALRQNALDLLTVGSHDDEDFIRTEHAFYVVWERLYDAVPPEVRSLLGDLEEAMTAHVSAAEDAVARAWLRERGSVPVVME